MKRVRFQIIQNNQASNEMDDLECHFPRPFITRASDPVVTNSNDLYSRILQMKSDPLSLYDASNSSPQFTSVKTKIDSAKESEIRCSPCNELDLSMLDTTLLKRTQLCRERDILQNKDNYAQSEVVHSAGKNLTSTSNANKANLVPKISRDNSFFMKPENAKLLQFPNEVLLQKQLTKHHIGKENNSTVQKVVTTEMPVFNFSSTNSCNSNARNSRVCCRSTQILTEKESCCHNCKISTKENTTPPISHQFTCRCQQVLQVSNLNCDTPRQYHCTANYCMTCSCNASVKKDCNSQNRLSYTPQYSDHHQNAIEKKKSAINKYENSKKGECTEVEVSDTIAKQKREPTVADLFKIIKLQNEQLQLLQDKVDKFITASNNPQPPVLPIQNYVTEQIAVQTVGKDKISIGVMTSFEMYQTSTVINKETVKQTINNQNAQVQCNRSQISFKEVAFREPINQNFLDGIQRKNCNKANETNVCNSFNETVNLKHRGQIIQPEAVVEDKTVNDLSLCNVQVDNVTTPMISPEQTMYLDVRDFSDSDSGSDNHSNVGWTYYNKVMTHVNGMLQDSDMPSSASDLFKKSRQKCIQMQIDKTNISVTKRVKFGDDPLGLRQTHLYPSPATDTSMKMNQLAAKYLKSEPQRPLNYVGNAVANNDMSFATRNYMERHQILHGLSPVPPLPAPPLTPPTQTPEMPRFLDITALKQQQQYKLL